jgi:hypothetical protein
MAKTTPHLMLWTMMMITTQLRCGLRSGKGVTAGGPPCIDVSSQGPKRAVTDAGACPERIQPGTHSLQIHPPTRPTCKGDEAIKAMPSIRRCGHVPAVGRRQCRGSGVDGEGLMEAAQEASLFSPRDHWPLHHINS